MRPVLTADQIRDLLPHRWAFLLLDKVIELEPGKRGVGIKNVTISEPFFEGHFPKESIMPGALIIEALAQMTAVVYVTGELEKNGSQMNGEKLEVDPSSYVGYLVSLRNMKFLKPVVPGDQLQLHVQIGRSLGFISQVEVQAYVENKKVAEGSIQVSKRAEPV
ncbi:3-hydroxyacyl-ACP dehydratase FabZ [Paenibacillus larvae]|uniref:3-hydroxyacyl-[acyl-carrier-protein] dehydratase n=1 Tax=Paenibacillus larvae TaxID=1464 RepID=A0AAP5JUU8_9BACL|nr:3-hydroxyacyl-ACP dehydratase FabZ [Paenibacillus larvae]AQR78198.1 beta-hydroxyacyl-ACP dehydratase [Paenibacillus larvae subsp. larvae]AVF20606.1 (3R)-hydroxymyristoyl-[acyl-carrier-protein] dehydratase FabZ [Paenibacillus larvae subsp. larvae]ETK28431.1 (3R)-hydroxymyristoyl-[acyl carrier protein] dehydratase [Paenibacillus larvae subsp. larvae DSM 25719]MCY7477684.1 3-hydroxyacyl-ACP dehydratase FabZ [Paenibacillus larvae]MCY7491091.1 3-hydroxyacyl-ACP dehydratase FabZ [Paenibacillus la